MHQQVAGASLGRETRRRKAKTDKKKLEKRFDGMKLSEEKGKNILFPKTPPPEWRETEVASKWDEIYKREKRNGPRKREMREATKRRAR